MQTPDIPPKTTSSEPMADFTETPAVQATPEAAEGSSGGFLSKVKTLLSALLLIAISGGIGYGVGAFQSKLQVKQAREATATALADAETQINEANAKVAAAEARSEYTKVQLRLLESIDELEQRNFGNANTQLRLASETLGRIEISKDPAKLAELKEELSTGEINFAVNPVEQRKLMLNYSATIDALLPE